MTTKRLPQRQRRRLQPSHQMAAVRDTRYGLHPQAQASVAASRSLARPAQGGDGPPVVAITLGVASLLHQAAADRVTAGTARQACGTRRRARQSGNDYRLSSVARERLAHGGMLPQLEPRHPARAASH